jgi:hypothetical protein
VRSARLHHLGFSQVRDLAGAETKFGEHLGRGKSAKIEIIKAARADAVGVATLIRRSL